MKLHRHNNGAPSPWQRCLHACMAELAPEANARGSPHRRPDLIFPETNKWIWQKRKPTAALCAAFDSITLEIAFLEGHLLADAASRPRVRRCGSVMVTGVPLRT